MCEDYFGFIPVLDFYKIFMVAKCSLSFYTNGACFLVIIVTFHTFHKLANTRR